MLFSHESTLHWFENFKEVDSEKVILGNSCVCKVTRIGQIRLKFFDGTQKMIFHMMYVLDLRRNLISLCTLDDSGYDIRLENESKKILKEALLVLKRVKSNKLYIL